MDLTRLSHSSNMCFADRATRLFVGGVLVYTGLFQYGLSDSALINTLAGVFGLTNIIASVVGICPGYLLANFSTNKNATQDLPLDQSDSRQETDSQHPAVASYTTNLKGESIHRILLLSITVPVAIVLAVFAYLFFELSTSYRESSDTIAVTSIAEMALLFESTGEASFADYRNENVVAIVFHDAYGNVIPTVLEKIPSDPKLRRMVLEQVALKNNDSARKFEFHGNSLIKSTESLVDRGLHVSVFYKSSDTSSTMFYPLVSRLVFAVLLALWLSGWTAHYILKRYTEYVAKNSEAIRFRSTHDLLTGLPNRTGLEEMLHERVTQYKNNQAFAVITVDIANFHYFNDTLGHKLGDKLLIEISSRLKSIIHSHESLARLNGDEFCAVISLNGDHNDAFDEAAKIRRAICQPINIDAVRLDVECNIGLSIYPDQSTDAVDLIRLSNIALHYTKGQSVHITAYDAAQDRHDDKSLAIITGLQTAIEDGQLKLVYQPKIDVKTGELHGVEALVRWQHPIYQTVPPVEFIGWAEKSGLINQLTKWVLSTAELQSKEWLEKGMSIPIAVNLSPINLEDEQILSIIKHAATEGYFQGGLLELELTENAVVKNIDKAFEKMGEIKALGVSISIDDFGTGLASFSYLRNFPVTNLKIDRSFVNIEAPDEHDLVLLHSMIELGHNLNCVVTAEGVENDETLELLRASECDFAQGYHICRPISPNEIEHWIEENKISLFDIHTNSTAYPKIYRNVA